MDVYENFHKMFSGCNQNTFNICRECGGECEHNKIGTLLPGEKEYMAKKMGINVLDFKVRYLDILKMDDETLINVLKLGKLCPFLNEETKECKCKNFKPIFCKIYPIIFTVDSGKIKFKMDHWCRLSRKKECRAYFETAIPLLLRLPVPIEWFIHVTTYDNLCFDYDRLKNYRNKKDKHSIFSLDEILSLQKAEIGTVNLCIDFSQRVKEQAF
jgi:Fe-S-cluster containining protein